VGYLKMEVLLIKIPIHGLYYLLGVLVTLLAICIIKDKINIKRNKSDFKNAIGIHIKSNDSGYPKGVYYIDNSYKSNYYQMYHTLGKYESILLEVTDYTRLIKNGYLEVFRWENQTKQRLKVKKIKNKNNQGVLK
jgi:hypothetical protein